LFYYAGHGIQVDGTNYIIPIDAKLENKIAVRHEAVSVNDVVAEFEYYQNNTNIVILDACRGNMQSCLLPMLFVFHYFGQK